MTVDFSKAARILVVHGVQTGTDADIEASASIEKLVDKALARSHLSREFESKGFYYEDINDDAQRLYQLLGDAISSGNKLANIALDKVIDLVGDVVSAARDTSTASLIRKNLRQSIVDAYEAGQPLLLVAHSLGTIYALDVVSEMMAEDEYFQGDDSSSWPVQGLVTLGSPLGLAMDIGGHTLFEQRSIAALNARYSVFPWHNFYNRLDPVVSGNVFGSPVELSAGKGPVERRYGELTRDSGWLLHGHAVTSGKQWLLAHTAYWKNPRIGDRIVDLIWG